jgi:hypothetical protein
MMARNDWPSARPALITRCAKPEPVHCESARHRTNIGFQLREVEAWRKAGLVGFRRQDGIRLVHARIPPGPSSLLCIPPSQHGHAILVIRNGIDRVGTTSLAGRNSGRRSERTRQTKTDPCPNRSQDGPVFACACCSMRGESRERTIRDYNLPVFYIRFSVCLSLMPHHFLPCLNSIQLGQMGRFGLSYLDLSYLVIFRTGLRS